MIRRPPRSTLFPYTTPSDLVPITDETGLLVGILTNRDLRFAPDASQPVSADRKSTRLNSSHQIISYAVFCLKKKNTFFTKERHHANSHNTFNEQITIDDTFI